MTGDTTIVVGPRTRAGAAVVERALARGGSVHVLARHADDHAALSGGDVTVLRIGQDLDLLGAGDGPVRVVVCALGPVHPDAVRSEADMQAFLRDLDAIERLLAATSGRRDVGVVLVSSVIALAPGPDRRYYGGWKCLVEQQLATVVARTSPGATFSVVYPGRLVAGPRRRRVPGLHTTYRGLAAAVDILGRSSRTRISGIDARLWLVMHGARLFLTPVRPPRASTPDPSLELHLSANDRNSRP
jgi:nucleoside-diphosphate-sugar epimerase